MRPRVASPTSQTRILSQGELDFSALGATLLRKKWSILRPTILVGLATLLAVQVITPKYQSESRIFIEGRDNVYLRPDVDRDTSDRNAVDQEAVTSQAQIILSRDLAQEVIKKLKLGERPEFDPTLSGVSPIKAVLGLFGLVRDPLSMTPEERVLEAYYDRLTVTPVANSRVIDIDFLSQDPELAAQVANAIADGYLVRQREATKDQAKSAGDWLSGEIETMRQKVEDAEAKVEDFRAKANLLVGNNNTTLSAQSLGDVNAQLAAARTQKVDAEAKAKLIRDMLHSGEPIESSDILNSELIRRLAEQRITLKAQLAEQSSTLLDDHPRIKELKAQIADLDGQIRTETETIARSFENDSKLASARMDSQVAMLDQLKNQAAGTNDQDVQLRALERDAKSQRDLLESYLAKYREATSRDSIASTPADARVVSRATVSNIPAYPKKLPTVLIATFATLVLSSGLIMTREILSAPVSFVPVRPSETAFAGDGLAPRVAGIVNEPRWNEPSAASPSSIASVAYNLRHAGRRRAARGVQRRAGVELEPGRDQARPHPGGGFPCRAGRARFERHGHQRDFQRADRRRPCRACPRYRLVWQHHHQGQAFAVAPDHFGAGGCRSDRHPVGARHGDEIQRAGAQLRSRFDRCRSSRRAGDRAHRRDRSPRGPRHRLAFECREGLGARAAPCLGIWRCEDIRGRRWLGRADRRSGLNPSRRAC
jgi:uncharacterized protein involved in exopolysaccharide biosynthesis